MIALSTGMSWAIVLFLAAFWIFIFALMKSAARADRDAEEEGRRLEQRYQATADAVWEDEDAS